MSAMPGQPSIRGDIRKLFEGLDEVYKAVMEANKRYNDTRNMVVAVHREQSAFRAIVQRRFEAIHDAIQSAGPLQLRRRLKRLLLPITDAEIRAEVKRVDQELRNVAETVRPAEPGLSDEQAAKIRSKAEAIWEREQKKNGTRAQSTQEG